VTVSVVPGPSAALGALVASGLPSDRFCFEGFLPRKGGERAARLAAIAAEPRTTVVFEAPHRVARTLNDLLVTCGADRPVAVARELTKLHEEMWRGTLVEAVAWVARGEPRGEFVVVVGGVPPRREPLSDGEVRAALIARLEGGDDHRGAVAGVVAELGVGRRRAYQLALEVRAASGGAGASG
jgi:16S rRNA (cytidine1402-2'-O)-methyltransferase